MKIYDYLELPGEPVNPNHAATKGYVDSNSGVGSFLELSEIVTPGPPTPDSARIFLRDNGAGKSELAVIFSSGNIVVIATEI